jgi:hypothetical protein
LVADRKLMAAMAMAFIVKSGSFRCQTASAAIKAYDRFVGEGARTAPIVSALTVFNDNRRTGQLVEKAIRRAEDFFETPKWGRS